ncbi:SDR family oxidoreductase [Pseudoxanthomonas composti]|uniref:SDR family oxidoreductase n=1 Tax=Pseudoxanthomonas composti TaxID=2137479 RepID=A0A4Q1JVQ9_9GAMM|nr:SDR family oxidoreductase [Pseudoxanthomonas composti]RXR06143.1 SDR family oxidoreductase [Pseudoxanthomonas composti]
MARLQDKTALVIGGASGIGAAIAQRFVAEGARTWITGRNAEQTEAAAGQIGTSCHAERADPGVQADLDALRERLRAQGVQLDTLVVNAGMSGPAALGSITDAHFDGIFGLNVRALVFTVQTLLPLMREGGSIVLVGSIADIKGIPAYSIYAASKAAVRSLARSWTVELAPRGIRVNVVSPGPTDTAMMAATSEEVRAALVAPIPLGRMGRPQEVASAALFLASEDGSYVAGAELCVDGGMAQI